MNFVAVKAVLVETSAVREAPEATVLRTMKTALNLNELEDSLTNIDDLNFKAGYNEQE